MTLFVKTCEALDCVVNKQQQLVTDLGITEYDTLRPKPLLRKGHQMFGRHSYHKRIKIRDEMHCIDLCYCFRCLLWFGRGAVAVLGP